MGDVGAYDVKSVGKTPVHAGSSRQYRIGGLLKSAINRQCALNNNSSDDEEIERLLWEALARREEIKDARAPIAELVKASGWEPLFESAFGCWYWGHDYDPHGYFDQFRCKVRPRPDLMQWVQERMRRKRANG